MAIKAGSKKEKTRERILRAAARAIRKHGYDGLGVADVMKEAGLTHGGFYAHFASRDALLAQAAEQAGAESTENLSRAIDRKSTRLNSSHRCISYAVFCLKKKNRQ